MESTINNKFESKEQYENFIKTWKEEFKNARKLERNEYGNKIRQFTDLDFFFYALMRGTDPQKCYHSKSRYTDALNEMKWYFDDDPHYIRRTFAKFITDDGLTLDITLKTWNKYSEGLSNG